MTSDLESFERRAREAALRLTQAQAMRHGSVSPRFVRCNKPNCACRRAAAGRHGPYLSLTHSVGGKTRSRLLTPEQAALARRQIAAGRAFRDQVRALWDACEAWADAQLEELPRDDGEGGARPRRRKQRAPTA